MAKKGFSLFNPSRWPCSCATVMGPNGEMQMGWLVSLASLSFLLNVVVVVLLMNKPSFLTVTPAENALNESMMQSLHSDLNLWKTSHETVKGQFEALKTRYTDLETEHEKLLKAAPAPAVATDACECTADQLKKAEAEVQDCSSKSMQLQSQLIEKQKETQDLLSKLAAASNGVAVAAGGSAAPCPAIVDTSRLLSSDLSAQPFDLSSHEVTWECNKYASKVLANETMQWCPETATNEQYFQLTFFDRPGAGSRAAIRKGKPVSPTCVQLPPRDYQFPKKLQSMPLAEGEDAVHWPNLRVEKLEDLLVFNRGTPKNLYHFNASFYDYEQEGILDVSAKYIPWGHKVRTMLDVGSGGASLGMLAKRRYDVQVVSTVFADWPYCEYISERGQICMYVDAMEAMPFAKFSYDVVHSSWVFHALFNWQLRAAYLEQNRVLRPGGYMWIYGGWSLEQVETIHHLLVEQLGYTYLLNQKNMVDTTKVKHKFDTVPFELEWTAILLKPIRVAEETCQRVTRGE